MSETVEVTGFRELIWIDATIPNLFDQPEAIREVEPPRDYILKFGTRRRPRFLPDTVLPDPGDQNHSDRDLST